MFHDIEGKYYRFKKGGNTMKREDYISDETVVKRAKEAVRLEIEKNKALRVLKKSDSSLSKELGFF